ncbi:hypothetical protein DY000_02026529 [Brassica cretica]|uniref:Uncharacterized protein n=1 Tax=Brassica cretica TaxID=69181 RepID=A0ABQ7EE75_BRACR|nr:hypothetical protein DY000_02026529 [Brassica cretica]
MHVKTTPISGIIPHFVSSNSFLFLPSNQILTEEIDLPVEFEEMVSPETANWIFDLIDTDYGSFTIQGLRVGLRVYAGDSPGRMSPIFKSAVLAKYYGEKKRRQKEKKKRENTDEVQRFGRGTGVVTSGFELVMWTLRWLHQERDNSLLYIKI